MKENIPYTFSLLDKMTIKYYDKVLKKDFHNKTIGVLVSKKNNKFILEYISDENLFLTTYKINN